jgi:hypothetical protein
MPHDEADIRPTDGLPQYEAWPGSRVDVRKTSDEA